MALLQRRQARRSLTEFAISQGLEPAPHHQLLIDELERLEHGENDFLLVEMPPGSAKSTYVNWLFPAWHVARNKGTNVLTASHSSELAERWGRRTRNLLQASSNLLAVSVSADSGAAYRWATTAGCEYYAVGVGVGIMGFRADLGIIDDPFGSREDAESKRIRDKIWEWYVNDFSSRLKPGAKRVIMHQRFHEDDLAGRVAKQMEALGRPYRRLKIRAEAVEDDPLGRKPGEFLWDDPTGYDYGRFLRDRKLESDARTWSALYQQRPAPEDGDFFKRSWFDRYAAEDKPKLLSVYGTSDYAVTGGGGDRTIHRVWGVDPKGHIWLLDGWKGQQTTDVWIDRQIDLIRDHKPFAWFGESGVIQKAIEPFLNRRMQERKTYCRVEWLPSIHDKPTRARGFQARAAMGMVHIPDTIEGSDWVDEMIRFPTGKYDDDVDCASLLGRAIDEAHPAIVPDKPKEERPADYGSRRQDDNDWKSA